MYVFASAELIMVLNLKFGTFEDGHLTSFHKGQRESCPEKKKGSQNWLLLWLVFMMEHSKITSSLQIILHVILVGKLISFVPVNVLH